jgi:hypothetical protein
MRDIEFGSKKAMCQYRLEWKHIVASAKSNTIVVFWRAKFWLTSHIIKKSVRVLNHEDIHLVVRKVINESTSVKYDDMIFQIRNQFKNDYRKGLITHRDLMHYLNSI